jgi:drug/metabolite transporter (DMT)-like permease
MASVFGLMAAVLFAGGLVAGAVAMRQMSLTAVYACGQIVGPVSLGLAAWLTGTAVLPGWSSATVALIASGLVAGLFGRWFALAGAHRLGPAVSGTVQAGAYAMSASALAALLLGQHVGLSRALGIAATLAGLSVAIFGRRSAVHGAGELAPTAGRPSTSWIPLTMLIPTVAGLCYGIAEQLRAYGVGSPLEPLTSALTVSVATMLVWAAMTLARTYRVWRKPSDAIAMISQVGRWPPGQSRARLLACVAGLTYVGAILSLLAGLQVGDVSQVSPVAATQPLWLVLFASLVARERRRLDRHLVLGSVMVVVGAAWIGTH